jgi:hypothetical protein
MGGELVFLFGAGASQGALHIKPHQPPLGRELYDALAAGYPKEWGPESHLHFFAADLRDNKFERTMAEEVCPRVAPLSILEWYRPMALFFSSFAPDGTEKDLYSELLRALRGGRRLRTTVFGSLNYDCIFELAALRQGLTVSYQPATGGDEAVEVLKVHGSCNFITEDMSRWRHQLTSPGASVEFQFRMLPPAGLPETLGRVFSNRETHHYPIMSLYATGKGTIVAPVQIWNIRNSWGARAREADMLVIIGVSPNPEDLHVWEPVRETRARVFYVGGKAEFGQWPVSDDRKLHLGPTFKDASPELVRQLGLQGYR